MGRRGPLPDPNSQRQQDKARKAAVTALVPAGRNPPTVLESPHDLGAAGRATWEQVWTQPQVSSGDVSTVRQLCALQDQTAGLQASLEEHGSILTKPSVTPRGDVVGEERYPNPALRELRRIGTEELALAKELGLTPTARARLGLAVVDIQSKMKPDFLDILRKERAKRRGEPDPGIDTRRAPTARDYEDL
jgi:P27 family predicted phage terminase small subunit